LPDDYTGATSPEGGEFRNGESRADDPG